MALPATDSFSGTNEPLSGSANWSLSGATSLDGVDEASGFIAPADAGGDDNAYYWTADTFADDQRGQIRMTQDVDGSNARIGVMLRTGASAVGFLVRYRTATADSDFEAYYYTGVDARTQLTSPTADQGSVDGNNLDPSEAYLAGDIMAAEIVGKTLTLLIDFGSGFINQGNWDATGVGPDSGSVGLYMAGEPGGSAVRGDDFEGSNVSSGINTIIIVPTGPPLS